MKNVKRTLAFASALMLVCSMTACGNDSGSAVNTTAETTTAVTPAKELSEEDKAAVAEVDVGDDEKLENGTIKWLATYDLNPEKGKPKMFALELFETKYGGNIEWIPTTWDNRYNDLSTLVLGGTSPDLFPAQEFDTFPSKVVDGMFQPFDDYLDFDSDLWSEGCKKLAEAHVLGGKHYVAPVATDSKCLMIYNKRTIEENGLPDPAELLAEDNWTWDTFRQMCLDYCDREDDKFAYDSWYFETQFLLTTGVAPISMEDGLVKSNLTSVEIERAENFMYDLKKDDLPLPKPEFNWTEQPQRISEGKTLFWPCATWCLWEADLSKFGEQGEIMFVPMPKDPEADKYYLPANMDAYALCKGAANPEGAAAFIKCKLIAEKDESAIAVTEKQYREDYGWTDEMFEMWYKVREMTDANPVVSLHMGLSKDVSAAVDDGLKQASFNGTDWASTRESISGFTQTEVDELNKQIQENY
ncbi:MAG: extracellular solute-binding protein [Oscillospiraceae bacterium]|nr:extracellular solute-binding protein [Oscillospiraceae bacterium]